MRITLFTTAAQGDTRPFLALAVRLKREGHAVKLAARPDFAGLAAEYGVDFAPVGHQYEPRSSPARPKPRRSGLAICSTSFGMA